MKLSLEEARDRAVTAPIAANVEDCVLEKDGVRIAMIGVAGEREYNGDTNTGLLAHCYNNFDAVVSAFEAYVDNTVADYGELLMGDCGLNEARAALKKAKEVEV